VISRRIGGRIAVAAAVAGGVAVSAVLVATSGSKAPGAGADGDVRAHRLDARMPLAIVTDARRPVPVDVVVRSGETIAEVADDLARVGLAASRDQAIAAAKGDAVVARLGLPPGADSVEGYLYPDRYAFAPGTPIDRIYEVMVERHRDRYRQLATDHGMTLAPLTNELGWTDREIVILASIVEKETAHPENAARVAGVLVERLRSKRVPHRLEVDSAIRYGCEVAQVATDPCRALAPGERLHAAQLRDAANPYNTYANDGLPPGPIASPGEAALAAAMNPATTGDLYYLSMPDGTMVFSRTMAEHQAAIEKALHAPVR
jgi:UPF0755 protein